MLQHVNIVPLNLEMHRYITPEAPLGEAGPFRTTEDRPGSRTIRPGPFHQVPATSDRRRATGDQRPATSDQYQKVRSAAAAVAFFFIFPNPLVRLASCAVTIAWDCCIEFGLFQEDMDQSPLRSLGYVSLVFMFDLVCIGTLLANSGVVAAMDLRVALLPKLLRAWFLMHPALLFPPTLFPPPSSALPSLHLS